jgi:hypothetical protein
MKRYFAITAAAILFCIFLSCDKPGVKETPVFELASPDGKVKLGGSVSELLDKINATIKTKEAVEIEKIEYPKASKGYYSVVTFRKKDGQVSNMVFAPFLINVESSRMIIHQSGNSAASSQAPPSQCYKFWCTAAGTCTSCQARLDDPYGNPTLSCSCDQCHMNGQQVPCE